MKLRKILKHIDCLTDVCIFKYDKEKGDEEELYCGSTFDVPWSIAEYKLDTDTDGEAISCFTKKDNNGMKTLYISIFVKEK